MQPLVQKPPPVPRPVSSLRKKGANAVLAFRYVLLQKIGEGGYGVVYLARDRNRWGKLVAVKEINMGALSPREMIEATDSYNREVSLLSSLDHPNLPHVSNYFTDSQHWYVVMEYIPGKTLEEYLQQAKGKKFSVEKTLEIGIALCDVLQYLHQQRSPVIFRDVKPANIMYTREKKIFLIDFGIARRYTPGKKRDTGPLGSPGFAAPEQYGRAQTTAQTDIYGLGATLQTLLTGKDPLELKQDAQGLRTLRKAPPVLQTLLQEMLDEDASQRPQDMLEVKKRLEKIYAQVSFKLKAQTIKRVLLNTYCISLCLVLPFALGILATPSWPLYLITVVSAFIAILAAGVTEDIGIGRVAVNFKEIKAGMHHRAQLICKCLTVFSAYYFVLAINYDVDWAGWSSLLINGLTYIAIIGGIVFSLRLVLRFISNKHSKRIINTWPPLPQVQQRH